MFSTSAIEIIKWVKKCAVVQAKVSHILRPGNTAFNKQISLLMVSKDSIEGYMRSGKSPSRTLSRPCLGAPRLLPRPF
jgi:hypothetical protein